MKKIILRTLLVIAILIAVFAAYLAFLVNQVTSVSEGEKIRLADRTETVLLVIDIQEGITGPDAPESNLKSKSSNFIPQVNQVIELVNQSKIPIVYIQQQTENWLLNWGSAYILAEGSPGVDVDKRVEILSGNFITKPLSDSFSNPELDAFLNAFNVRKVMITGLDIAECAGRTAEAALNRGYEVVVIDEAVISDSDERKSQKLNELKTAGAEVISIDQLADYLATVK